MSINGFNVSGTVHKYNYPALDNISITRSDISDGAFCDFADPYSSSKTYSIGDYAFYNQVLYRCIFPITISETWTASHWTAEKLGNNTAELRSAIAHLGESTKRYLTKTVIPNENKIVSFSIDLKPSNYLKILHIIDGGEGGYYSYGLYYGGTIVYGLGPGDSGDALIWVPAGSTKNIILPTNITADSIQFRNRNSRVGTTIEIEAYREEHEEFIKYLADINYYRRFGIEPSGYRVYAFNGASADALSRVITIPAGSSGRSSYYEFEFPYSSIKNYPYSSQKGMILLCMKCNASMENLNPVFFNVGVFQSVDCRLISVYNDAYIYGIRFSFPSNLPDSGSEIFNCQLGDPITASSETTIQLISATMEWDGYDQTNMEKMPSETIITVGTGKQYTSLRTALEYAATISKPTNHVTVQYYGNGVEYNLINDINASDLTASSTFKGLVVPAYCKLLGMGSREQNKISLTLPSGTDADAVARISTINLVENAELENLWIYGKNCRYACHDDDQTYNPTWELKTIRNCRFTSDYTAYHRAYGAGYRSGINWRFENCIFENINGEGSQFGNAAFSAHNNNSIQKSPTITFVNCQASGGHAFGFESLNATEGQDYPNAKTIISFYGCKGTALLWDRPVQTSLPFSNADLEVCVTGFGNNFGNNDVAVYYDGHYYNDDFANQLTLWGKITE